MAQDRHTIEIAAEDGTASAFRALRAHIGETRAAVAALNGTFAVTGGAQGVGALLGALGALGRFALPAALVASFAGVVVAASRAHGYLLDLGKASADLGLRVGTIDALGGALRRVGGSSEQAIRALRTLRDEADSVMGERVATLEELFKLNNRSLTDASGQVKPVADIYREVAEMIRNAKSETDALHVATVAFKDDAEKMMKAILGGADALDKLKGTEALDPLVKQAREFDALIKALTGRVQDFVDALTGRIKTYLLPYLSAVYDKLTEIFGERNALGQQARLADIPARLRLTVTGPRIDGRGPPTRTRRPREAPDSGPDRAAEVLRYLEEERRQLTFNRDILYDSQRAQMEIVMLRRAGTGASKDDQDEIKRSVALLWEMKKGHEEIKRLREGLVDAMRYGGDLMVDAIDGLINRTRSWNDILQQTLRSLARAALQAALLGEGPLSGILGTRGRDGLLGGLIGGLLNPLLPGRAMGGPVMAGSPYMVGERGPEVIVPRQSGTVLPNRALGGVNVTINAPIDARGAAPGVGEEIAAALERRILSKVVPLVRDARGRGAL